MVGQELPDAELPPRGTMVLSTSGTDRRALRNEMLVFALAFLIIGGAVGYYLGARAGGAARAMSESARESSNLDAPVTI